MPAGPRRRRLVLPSYMAVIPESVRQQLKDRFETVLSGPAQLTLYTRPGSSRLFLPAALRCPTCEDARQMAELLRDPPPDKVTLLALHVSRAAARAELDAVS